VDSIEPVWLFGAIVLACGILLGMLINRLLNSSTADVDQLKSDLERERAEMERYKASVNSHFNKTSDLVKELTQDYVKVYQHLAEGAQTLSDTPEFTQVLEQPQGRVLISVESDADEAVVVTDANTTADFPERLQAESPQAEASAANEPSMAAAPADSAGATQPAATADKLSAAEVAAPKDYAGDDEDDKAAAQSVGTDSKISDDTDKAADQDTDKSKDIENDEPAVPAEDAAASSSQSTPAPTATKQAVADEDDTKPAR
jgi:uncharacterized membrane-anchored protein YhcB (DUF1043 family)